MVIVWKLISQNEIHPKVILSISTIDPTKNPELPFEKHETIQNKVPMQLVTLLDVIKQLKKKKKKKESGFKNTEIQVADKGDQR